MLVTVDEAVYAPVLPLISVAPESQARHLDARFCLLDRDVVARAVAANVQHTAAAQRHQHIAREQRAVFEMLDRGDEREHVPGDVFSS